MLNVKSVAQREMFDLFADAPEVIDGSVGVERAAVDLGGGYIEHLGPHLSVVQGFKDCSMAKVSEVLAVFRQNTSSHAPLVNPGVRWYSSCVEEVTYLANILQVPAGFRKTALGTSL